MNILAYLTIISAIIGVTGGLGVAVFYLKYTATKSNLEGKDETIETLEKSRNAYRDRNEELEKQCAATAAENKVLREIATQTPEILSLTAVVTSSVKAQNKVANNVASLTSKLSQYLGNNHNGNSNPKGGNNHDRVE